MLAPQERARRPYLTQVDGLIRKVMISCIKYRMCLSTLTCYCGITHLHTRVPNPQSKIAEYRAKFFSPMPQRDIRSYRSSRGTNKYGRERGEQQASNQPVHSTRYKHTIPKTKGGPRQNEMTQLPIGFIRVTHASRLPNNSCQHACIAFWITN